MPFVDISFHMEYINYFNRNHTRLCMSNGLHGNKRFLLIKGGFLCFLKVWPYN